MNHFEIYSTVSSLRTKEEILDETLDSNDVLKHKKYQAYTQWNFLDYIWWLWALTYTKTQREKLYANSTYSAHGFIGSTPTLKGDLFVSSSRVGKL